MASLAPSGQFTFRCLFSGKCAGEKTDEVQNAAKLVVFLYICSAWHLSRPRFARPPSPKGRALSLSVTAFAVPAACGRPGRGSDSPLGCHSLPRLRFAYPQREGQGRCKRQPPKFIRRSTEPVSGREGPRALLDLQPVRHELVSGDSPPNPNLPLTRRGEGIPLRPFGAPSS